MITKEMEDVLNHYQTGLNSYKQRRWDEAITSFEMALKIRPDDGPSKLYLERATEYRRNPPPDDWDGVFTMTTK